MTDLPFSPAADRNRHPIQEVLKEVLIEGDEVLEIGSGTGQHAVHMAQHFPYVRWQTSDREENLPGIAARIAQAGYKNLPAPIALDVFDAPWPEHPTSVLYTANTFHIMPPSGWPRVIEQAAARLPVGGRIVIYGPFRTRGKDLEISNLRFEQMLQRDAPHRGIRVQEDIEEYAESYGFVLRAQHAMPANNRCLVFARTKT